MGRMAAAKPVPEAPVKDVPIKDVEAQKDAEIKEETEKSGPNLVMPIILGVVGLAVIILVGFALWFKFGGKPPQCVATNGRWQYGDDAGQLYEPECADGGQCIYFARPREFGTCW